MKNAEQNTVRLEPPKEFNRRHSGRLQPYWVKCDLGFVLDISAEGMKLLAKKRLKHDVTCRIWDERNGVEIQADVMWTKRVRFRQHEVGLRFRAMPEEIAEDLAVIAARFHEPS